MPRKKNSKQKPNTSVPPKPPANGAVDQSLPSKQASLFKQVVKFYEMKQYKKGIKTCDLILKKYPYHGETLAMRGLILNCMNKKDQALALIKSGLRYNIRSHVCWHVYGLVYRSDRNYTEAIKCYLNALRIDEENVQILRDLSLLQMQKRDLKGFIETRRKILVIKPSQRVNWLAYIVGNQLNNNVFSALSIMTSYEKTIEGTESTMNRYDLSEMILYKNLLYQLTKDYGQALKHLQENQDKIVDKSSYLHAHCDLLLKQKRFQEAEQVALVLLERNTEEKSVHEMYRLSKGLEHAKEEEIYSLYLELQKKYPLSNYCKKYVLQVLSGTHAQYYQVMQQYCLEWLEKGIPSLFSELKDLYSDPVKVDVIEKIVKQATTNEKETIEYWAKYYLIFHYDEIEQFDQALEEAQKLQQRVEEEQRKAIDVYVAHARVLKHVGSCSKAHELLEHARMSDPSDRYLNTKCVRYAFRANKIEEGQRVVKLFLREGNSMISLYDMQCIWYEWSLGQSYERNDQVEKALKQYESICHHFEDMIEDQFDFHSYCMRKSTLRDYVEMLRFTDDLKSRKGFQRAAHAVVRMLRELSDQQVTTKGRDVDEKEASEVSDAAESKSKEYLKQATKYVKDLQMYAPKEVASHVAAISVYRRKQKYLLGVKALLEAHQCNAVDAELHVEQIQFWKEIEDESVPMNEHVRRIVTQKRHHLLGEKSLHQIAKEYAMTYNTSLEERWAAIQVDLLLKNDRQPEETRGEPSDPWTHRLCTALAQCEGGSDLNLCFRIMKWCQKELGEEAKEAFRQAVELKYPHAEYFYSKGVVESEETR